jgi:hypothetical protein
MILTVFPKLLVSWGSSKDVDVEIYALTTLIYIESLSTALVQKEFIEILTIIYTMLELF